VKEEFEVHSHKRYNILTGEWVLVSPHRSRRPWQGEEEEAVLNQCESYDSNCYLCPGNRRVNGDINPEYGETFVFDNDFPALEKREKSSKMETGLLKAVGESGICRVVCFSPDHSKSLADMSVSEIERVVSVWQNEYEQLGRLQNINYVQIFENKGSIMGCSNPHPHGQIWAQESIPNEVLKKDIHQKKYFKEHGSILINDYLKQELKIKERIVFENQLVVVLVPFWAVWPFEVMILPKESLSHIGLMGSSLKNEFAEAIKRLTGCYDQLFNCSFPYSSGIHQAPTDSENHDHWHWHMSFYPPLLRSATIKKFMVGYELLAMPQRDFTAEKATEILRSKMGQNDKIE